jgi:hypothetical protein
MLGLLCVIRLCFNWTVYKYVLVYNLAAPFFASTLGPYSNSFVTFHQYNFIICCLLSESNQSIALHVVYFLVRFSLIFFIFVRTEVRAAVKIQRTLT